MFGGTGGDMLYDNWGSNWIDAGAGNNTISSVSYNYQDGYADASMRPGIDQIIGGPGIDHYILFLTASRAMVADHILDLEMEQGGDVMDLTSEVGYLPSLTDDVDSFDAGPLRLTTNDRDTHLEAPFSGKD
jgi:Ca2+-binding RTX toxin-like protein